MRLTTSRPLIYLITDGHITNENFDEKSGSTLSLIQIAAEAGIQLIQLREKHLSTQLLFDFSLKAAAITKKTNTKLLINDRADIALAAEADGVHLTSTSVSAKIIRENFPADFIVGISTHSVAEAETAASGGADFAVFGPVFSTPDKGEPQGLEKMKAVCDKLEPFPILALGGVNKTNYLSALESGAAGFAAIRFLNDTDNLRKLAEEFGL